MSFKAEMKVQISNYFSHIYPLCLQFPGYKNLVYSINWQTDIHYLKYSEFLNDLAP